MNESVESGNDEELVAIASFADEVSVHLAASKLESEGIRAIADDPQQPVGGLHTSVLRVLAEDVTRAREILRETPARDQLI